MKRRSSLAAGALVGAVLAGVVAQAQTAQDFQPPRANRFVTVGCVGREPAVAPGRGGPGATAQFFITDNRGDTPTVYRLDGDAEALTFHVGHTVEVSGPLSPPPTNAAGPNAKAMVLKVSSLVYISTTCKK